MDKNLKNILSIYGSHDASAVFVDKNNKIRIIEYERFVKQRYAMYSDRFDLRAGIGTNQNLRERFINYILTFINKESINIILYNELSDSDLIYLKNIFKNAEMIKVGHHTAHASSGYYTSDFKEAFIISIDGGGNEIDYSTSTKTFIGKDDKIFNYKNYSLDLGTPYAMIGYPISEIKPGPDCELQSLAYAGKVMGLCAYGKVIEEWLKPIENFYYHKNFEQLSKNLNLDLSFNSLKGTSSYNLAATSQYVFEKIFFDTFWAEILSLNLDVILVGGCALNVLLNQKLKEKLEKIDKNLFVPANPNDCGLALGQFLSFINFKIKEDITYNGIDILDKDKFSMFVDKFNAKKTSIEELAQMVLEGKIIGIVNGCSEVGPRALGNRSIICNPCFKNMKDILNEKVKFREWFRPFAPVCRYEDKDKYFENAFHSKFMSYAPIVKTDHKDKLFSITHADGTARLQTVKETDHELFYKILNSIEKLGGIPIILNTSFNIKGLPILSSIEDALYVLENTKLDHVYVDGYIFSK
jgi:carbamoyltransferase